MASTKTPVVHVLLDVSVLVEMVLMTITDSEGRSLVRADRRDEVRHLLKRGWRRVSYNGRTYKVQLDVTAHMLNEARYGVAKQARARGVHMTLEAAAEAVTATVAHWTDVAEALEMLDDVETISDTAAADLAVRYDHVDRDGNYDVEDQKVFEDAKQIAARHCPRVIIATYDHDMVDREARKQGLTAATPARVCAEMVIA